MEPRRYAYIDTLRGYAILMVIAVHTSQAFPDLPKTLATILSQGARGVQLFFVTSALTLSKSWVARNEGATDFYTRRLFWSAAPGAWASPRDVLRLSAAGMSNSIGGVKFKDGIESYPLDKAIW